MIWTLLLIHLASCGQIWGTLPLGWKLLCLGVHRHTPSFHHVITLKMKFVSKLLEEFPAKGKLIFPFVRSQSLRKKFGSESSWVAYYTSYTFSVVLLLWNWPECSESLTNICSHLYSDNHTHSAITKRLLWNLRNSYIKLEAKLNANTLLLQVRHFISYKICRIPLTAP